MAATATALRGSVRPCVRCDEPVRTLVLRSGGQITVEAEPEAGGLYALDQYGHAVRRSLAVMSAELRGVADVPGAGFVAHECLRDVTWAR